MIGQTVRGLLSSPDGPTIGQTALPNEVDWLTLEVESEEEQLPGSPNIPYNRLEGQDSPIPSPQENNENNETNRTCGFFLFLGLASNVLWDLDTCLI